MIQLYIGNKLSSNDFQAGLFIYRLISSIHPGVCTCSLYPTASLRLGAVLSPQLYLLYTILNNTTTKNTNIPDHRPLKSKILTQRSLIPDSVEIPYPRSKTPKPRSFLIGQRSLVTAIPKFEDLKAISEIQ